MIEGGHDATLVTVTQIAALSEVGPSAVSNWRRRFDDFPPAVQTAPGGRDLFELEDVERWLARHGRLREGSGKRLLFAAADLLRSETSATQMVEVLGATLALVASESRRSGGSPASAKVESLMQAASNAPPPLDAAFQPLLRIEPAKAEDVLRFIVGIEEAELSECFEWILSQGSKQHYGQSDSGKLTELIAALVPDPDGTVYDPAVGWGGFLLSLWRNGGKPQLFGQEVDEPALTVARQRFLVEGIPASLEGGDTLTDDAWPHLRADVVVSDPPYGVRKNWPPGSSADPRWITGQPPPYTDFAWVQHVVHHLNESGRGYVFLSTGALFRRGKEASVRRELLVEGMVEAIVGLPPGNVPRASVPVALWILRRPGSDGRHDSVLMVHATGRSPRGPLAAEEMTRIAAIVHRWREGLPVAEHDRPIAAAAPVHDLLRRDANLDPSRWMTSDLTAADRARQEREFQDASASLEEARNALATAPAVEGPFVADRSRPWIEIDQLLDDGMAKLLRGSRIKDEDHVEGGSPVVRAKDLAGSCFPEEASCFVEPAAMNPQPTLTRAGDVLVAPRADRLTAVVAPVDGWVVAAPLQGLRLLDPVLEPRLVAAFLESPRNHRLVTHRMNVPLRDLEIPLLPRADAGRLLAALERLGEQQRLAEEIESGAGDLRMLLLSLASSAQRST